MTEIQSGTANEMNVTYKQNAFADSIREIAASHVALWQRLPLLGLLAWGNGGYSNQVQFLYQFGVWRVDDGKTVGLFGTYVDCESGELVSLHGSSRSPASNKDVIRSWFAGVPEGSTIDAPSIVSSFESEVAHPRPPYGQTLEEITQRRLELASRYSVRKSFSRSVPENDALDGETTNLISAIDPSTGRRIGF